MKKRIIIKTLAVAVIFLFIGIGIQSAFADNQSPIQGEIYKNSNCLVIGKSSNTLRLPTGVFSKSITFGWRDRNYNPIPAVGWIYTKGEEGEWLFEGEFLGAITFTFFPMKLRWIGIKNFIGYSFGISFLFFEWREKFFIGFAEKVKISGNQI